jgi:hypothetical protein
MINEKSSGGERLYALVRGASWTDQIPVLGGLVCIAIGVVELSWKPLVLGAVLLAFTLLRISVNGRVRE